MLVPTYKLKNVVACAWVRVLACVRVCVCWHMCVGVCVLECVRGVVCEQVEKVLKNFKLLLCT